MGMMDALGKATKGAEAFGKVRDMVAEAREAGAQKKPGKQEHAGPLGDFLEHPEKYNTDEARRGLRVEVLKQLYVFSPGNLSVDDTKLLRAENKGVLPVAKVTGISDEARQKAVVALEDLNSLFARSSEVSTRGSRDFIRAQSFAQALGSSLQGANFEFDPASIPGLEAAGERAVTGAIGDSASAVDRMRGMLEGFRKAHKK